MPRDLAPGDVAARLEALAATYVPETIAEGRARLRREMMGSDVFAAAVARRLDELRALDELTRYLHAGARKTRPDNVR